MCASIRSFYCSETRFDLNDVCLTIRDSLNIFDDSPCLSFSSLGKALEAVMDRLYSKLSVQCTFAVILDGSFSFDRSL